MIVGFDMCPQRSRVYAREVRLVEINRPLHLTVASLAERRQIPRQEVPLVTVQVVDRVHIGADPILDSAELATPHVDRDTVYTMEVERWRRLGLPVGSQGLVKITRKKLKI
jgi:hypothetical protein